MTRRTMLGVVLAGWTLQAQRRRSNAPRSEGLGAGVNDNLAGTFHGKLKDLNGKEIVLQTAEDQTVVIRRSRKTKFWRDGKEVKASGIEVDEMVSVDAVEDVDLKPIAVRVTVEKTRGGSR